MAHQLAVHGPESGLSTKDGCRTVLQVEEARDLAEARRWGRAVQRQADRMVAARRPLLSDDPITPAAMAEAWTWPDEAVFLLIAANHLGQSISALGWSDDFGVDWEYIRWLRNAWEHDDGFGKYRETYGVPHGTASWFADAGMIDKLDVTRLCRTVDVILDRVAARSSDPKATPSS